MLKKLYLFLLLLTFIEAQNLSSIFTQRGGSHNAIFLNPAKVASQNSTSDIEVNFIDTSISLSDESLKFLKELSSATSASNKNQEISQLLKKNIGKTLSFSAYNFSSISQREKSLSWSLGIANSVGGYFITHSGFGSQGAMESFIEKYKVFMATVALKNENIDYGVNIKSIEKKESIYNYSLQEMIENSSFSNYFDSKNSKKESSLDIDFGVIYTISNYKFNPQLSFSTLNIGNNSLENIGLLLRPYENSYLQLDYINLFQKEQNFEDSFKLDFSYSFWNKELTLNTGILYNALSFGAEYRNSIFSLALNSYKTKNYNQEVERRYTLTIGLLW